MGIKNFLLFVSLAALSACASNQPAEKATSVPQKQEATKKADKSEAEQGAIVGKPAKGSKFAKLKLGMSKQEVEAKIGKPNNEWQRPTGKSAIPFYFGDDRWVLEATYKKEGKLTFNFGGDQALTGMVVNPNEE